MKLNEYKLDNSKESIEMTFLQAKSYFEDAKKLVIQSNFDLFNQNEELSFEETRLKYNEINRRLQTLGQSFELYIKYILLCSKLEQNPSIKIEDLWGKWIRGHKIVDLINKAETLIKGFKKTFYTAFNAYYGFGSNKVDIFDDDTENLFSELVPKQYEGTNVLTDDLIDELLINNTSIYESCRYNTQSQTDYNFNQVWKFLSFVEFFANMIHSNNNSINIDYTVAYTMAKLNEKKTLEKVLKYRTSEEIDKILQNKIFVSNGDLLAYLLSQNKYSLEEINDIMSMDEYFKKPNILFYILVNETSVTELKKCKSEGVNILLMLSGFTLNQIKMILTIPKVGDYINSKPLLLLNLFASEKYDEGLTFEDLIEILNLDEIKCDVKLLNLILPDYKKIYKRIYNNHMCNSIFKTSLDHTESNSNELCCQKIKENIINNIRLYKKYSIKGFPLVMDSCNTTKIINFLHEKGITQISANLLTLPFLEVYAVVNYMKNNNLFSFEHFDKIFLEIYKRNSSLDSIFRIFKLSDNFLLQNGLLKKSNDKYLNGNPENDSIIRFKSLFD